MSNFNEIGSDFDDLFDEGGAITVEPPKEEVEDIELPDFPELDSDSNPDPDNEPDNPDSSKTTEPELDV